MPSLPRGIACVFAPPFSSPQPLGNFTSFGSSLNHEQSRPVDLEESTTDKSLSSKLSENLLLQVYILAKVSLRVDSMEYWSRQLGRDGQRRVTILEGYIDTAGRRGAHPEALYCPEALFTALNEIMHKKVGTST